jgi:hypothetical protein
VAVDLGHRVEPRAVGAVGVVSVVAFSLKHARDAAAFEASFSTTPDLLP